MSRHPPTPEQRAAADPTRSAWVVANAGSGKTRVLTQRVARLLLAGARPERILCLTYTKAAAVEMQSRLFAMLGGWAMAPDAALAADLAALEGGDRTTLAPGRLAAARRLFAAALETPGGLKIQTIHAFATELLRRFPLEAGVSPRFSVLEEPDRRAMLAEILRDMAEAAEAGRDPAFDLIARRIDDGALETLVGAILGAGELFERAVCPERLAQVFGVAANGQATAAAAALERVDWGGATALAAAMELAGSATMCAAATAIRESVATAATDPIAAAERLSGAFLTKTGNPRSTRSFPTKAVINAHPPAQAATEALIAWAVEAREDLAAAKLAERSADLARFARALLTRYAAAKARVGALDYADLLARAGALLTEAESRAWVLHKLDAGISHLLIDEAQDTAPQQWRIVEALTEELRAGQGAAGSRTVFVVGDEKQSIYSFQGADPAVFDAKRGLLETWLAGSATPLATPALITSFRSAPGILSYVDEVFAGRWAALSSSGSARHEASRVGDGARVDLWPLVEEETAASEAAAAEPPWWEPAIGTPRLKPKPRLARLLAIEIARMIRGARLPDRAGAPGRPVAPGDVLVLVRKRDALARELIKALKSEGVSVAGADRLRLAEGLAVRDLLGLAKIASFPGDDLTLAAVLRSPLVDLPEEALFSLAHGREGTLWAALMGSEHQAGVEMLKDLAGAADFLRPYEFLERALIEHDGRRRLVARLGPEAEDLIDELLEQALAYEARATPSLVGFVDWIETGGLEVKREMEAAAGAVRVMTVHGAKGLEAPVVVLADTVGRPSPRSRAPILADPQTGLALWPPGASEGGARVARLRSAEAERAEAERQRLLYVALTRAQDWLIVSGAGQPADAKADWYGQLAGAFERLDSVQLDGPEGLALRRHETPAVGLPTQTEAATAEAPNGGGIGGHLQRPTWFCRAAAETRSPRLAPSALAPPVDVWPERPGDRHPPGPRARDVSSGGPAYGRAVHLLLERFGAAAPTLPWAPAERLILASHPELSEDARRAALNEVARVLADPALRVAFAAEALTEVPIAVALPELSGPPMIGRVDRLCLSPGAALILDFKTDRAVPSRPETVPPAYLAQLGAYRAALGQVWPDLTITAGLIWTAEPRLMPLPDPLLARALAASLAGLGVADSAEGS